MTGIKPPIFMPLAVTPEVITPAAGEALPLANQVTSQVGDTFIGELGANATAAADPGTGQIPLGVFSSSPRKACGGDKNGAPLPQQFAQFSKVLELGIRDESQLPAAFDLISAVSPRWKGLIDEFDRLRQERVAEGTGSAWTGGGAFDIVVGGFKGKKGTYCLRMFYHDRRTALADGISLGCGVSVFALIHELTHAMPLESLLSELAALPCERSGARGSSFEEIFAGMLQDLYDEEAITSLAEVLLYREMKAAGVPVELLGTSSEEREWLEETLQIYEREGVVGYLQSEQYVGRNHRLDYNVSRVMQAAAMVASDPKLLADNSVKTLLANHGVEIEGSQAGNLPAALALMPQGAPITAETIISLLSQSGGKVTLDIAAISAQAAEAIALTSGVKRKASASFVGRRREVAQWVELLSTARRVFNYGWQEVERRLAGSGEEMSREDKDNLLNLFRLAAGFNASAEEGDKDGLERSIQVLIDAYAEVVGKLKVCSEEFVKDFKKLAGAALQFERARILRDRKGILQFGKMLDELGRGVMEQWNAARHIVAHFLAAAFADPFVVEILGSRFGDAVMSWHRELSGNEDLADAFAGGMVLSPKGAAAFARFAEAALLYPRAAGIAKFFPTSGFEKKEDEDEDEDKISFTAWEANFVQLLAVFTRLQLPRSKEFGLATPDPKDGTSSFYYGILNMEAILDYQRGIQLARLPKPERKTIKVTRRTGKSELDEDGIEEERLLSESLDETAPTIMHLGELWDAVPDVVSVFPGTFRGLPQGIVVAQASDLREAHLLIEQAERRLVPAEEVANHIVQILIENFNLAAIGVFVAGDVEMLSALAWVSTQLAVRLSFLLAKENRPDLASLVLNDTTEFNLQAQHSNL